VPQRGVKCGQRQPGRAAQVDLDLVLRLAVQPALGAEDWQDNDSVDANSVSSTPVTDRSVTLVIRVVSWRVTCAVGSSDARTSASRLCCDWCVSSNRHAP
jgi:hypothetical protein